MNSVGFPISHKENEKRRVILPKDINTILAPSKLYFESGYGEVLGISDIEYEKQGCNVVSRDEIFNKEIICDPKIGDAEYLDKLKSQIIFGWIHATQNKYLTDQLVKNKLTVFAWEKMFYKGQHVFWKNNELAGEAAIIHAFQYYGQMPYETKVALIGRGNTARGAMKILNRLGAEVKQFDRKTVELFRELISEFDVIINCVLWDVKREDHIVYKKDLKKMKNNSMIIDISCDRGGAIETSIPTTIQNPIYIVDGIIHYVVDHTPSIFYKTFSINNSAIIGEYINQLLIENYNETMKNAMIVENGVIIDQEIKEYQKR